MDSLKKLSYNKGNILQIILYTCIVFYICLLVYYKTLDDFLGILFYFLIIYCLSTFFRIQKVLSDFQSLLISLSISIYFISYTFWLVSIIGINLEQMIYLVSLLVMLLFLKIRTNMVIKDLEIVKNAFLENGLILNFIFVMFFIFFSAIASYPIISADSLAKHVAIPYQIINRGVWEYNLIESVVLGESSLLPHMNYLFLNIVGVEKIQILNVFISFLSLFILLEIAKYICKEKIYLILISICYLSLPLLFVLSTTLMVDIFPVLFLLSLILLLNTYIVTNENSFRLLIFVVLLYFAAYFSKQTALYVLIPLSFFILILFFKFSMKKINFFYLLLLSIINLIPYIYVFFKTGNPIFPYLNQIFKSEYFIKEAFSDTRWSKIGSLFEIIFNSSNYIEAENGILGLYLLLIILLPIILFYYKQNKTVLFILFIAISSYLLSVYITKGYLRYMLTSFILVIPILFLIYPILKNGKSFFIKFLIIFILIIPNTLFSLYYNFTKFNLGVKLSYDYLYPHDEITIAGNEEILSKINDKNIYILSNEPYRGIFKGRWFSLDWYGVFYQSLIKNGLLSEENFLNTFDYFLYKKGKDSYFGSSSFLNKDELLKKGLLFKVDETTNHILFKIKKDDYKSLLKFNDENHNTINISKPLSFNFTVDNSVQQYKISLDLDVTDIKLDTYSRFQINWINENNILIGTTIEAFKLESFRNKYFYVFDTDKIPKDSTKGILFVTGHRTEDNIIFHEVELYYKNKSIINKVMIDYLNNLFSYNLLEVKDKK